MRPNVSQLAKRFFSGGVTAHLGLAAGDFDDCTVWAEFQPEERDTNTREAVDVCSVYTKQGIDISELLTAEEADTLAADIHSRFCSYCEAYYEGNG